MMRDFELKLRLIRIFSDFVAVNIAWIVAYFIRLYLNNFTFFSVESVVVLPQLAYLMPFFIFSSLVYVLLAMFNGLYSFDVIYWFIWKFFRIIFLVFLWWLLIIAFYALWEHQLFFSRVLLFIVLFLTIVFLSSFRLFIRHVEKLLLKHWIWARKIFIIWEGSIVDKIKRRLKFLPQFELEKVSNVFSEKHSFKDIDSIWYFWNSEEEKNRIVNYCQIKQIWFSFSANTWGILVSRLKTSMVWGYPLLTVITTPIYWWWKFIKRNVDIFFSLMLIILLSPIFIVIWILVKIDSKGPIFYGSKRIWMNWKLFKMWKFRSMVTNADDLKQDLSDKNHRTGPLFKIKNDPRVTKFWKFIRRFSIDELPQIWNVLKWQMSFVGPRAHLPEEVSNYTPLQLRVLTIKPWITGLAQINWRSDLEFEEEIRLDLQYIVQWSFLLDTQIMIQTPLILLKWEGAD